MIKRWLVTGDTHRDFSRFQQYPAEWNNDETAVIILGDVGLNVLLNEHDTYIKKYLRDFYNFYIYCIRGNHEARPSDVPNMEKIWDNQVNGYVYYEKDFPKIRYFLDYGIYFFDNKNVLVIGGAYSVDKYYRLANNHLRWFENEELTEEEMDDCMLQIVGRKFDLVLTHTCPLAQEPSDLFLGFIDQTMVSKRMEKFLDEVRQEINEGAIWLWGHFHADRIEVPYGEMFFKDTEELSTIFTRWANYKNTHELDWWLSKGPRFYMWV